MDHIFVMIAMVEKALAKSKGKLYIAFVDFRKAYDSVNRNILWDVLRRAGAKDAKGTENNVQFCCSFCQSGSRLYDRRVILPCRAQAVGVYGESGRYPLAVSSRIRSIKYWPRLLKLNQDRLPFGAYRCY